MTNADDIGADKRAEESEKPARVHDDKVLRLAPPPSGNKGPSKTWSRRQLLFALLPVTLLIGEQAKADIDYYNVNFKRQQELLARNAASQANFDDARHNLQGAQQKLASLSQQLAGIAANLNGNPDAPIEDHPRYKDVLAARDEAARQLAHTTVRAPFPGIVTNVPALQPGQYLAAAATAFNIVSTDHVWVQASPKETELTYVKPGQKATVEVDSYPGQQWTGTVESISPASASSFSLLPAENTSGNWVKVVQRIPMRVRVDDASGKPPLRVGMSVSLDVDTGHARGLPRFISGLFGASTAAGAERD
jgi:membrane fusion protein (multidrug efflux system)